MDYLIKNATVIDGTGKPRYVSRVGIDKGKIVTKNLPTEAENVIDAAGKILCPGFIDCHSHGDMVLGEDFGDLCKLNQGITTQIAGQCGDTVAPVSEICLNERANQLRGLTKSLPPQFPTWKKWSDYADYIETLPMALNVKSFIGFNSIRIAVMGYSDRKPTKDEVKKMQELLADAMEHGVVGMSSGLAYIPGTFTDTADVAEIAKVMAPYGGIYASHIRNESFGLIPSLKEAIEIGKLAGVDVNVSHFKVMGRPNWGKAMEAADVIDKAREAGMNVTADQYPYNRTMTQLYPSMPPRHFTDGIKPLVKRLSEDKEYRKLIRSEMEDEKSDYENRYLDAGGFGGITVCSALNTPQYSGMTVKEVAEATGKDPFDAFFDLLVDNSGIVTATYHSISDEDILDIVRLPYVMIGTDGIVRDRSEHCHPRGWGTMVHAIVEFTKKRQVLTLEELIHKNTEQAAIRYRLKNKGVIKDGYDADLVLFDYENLIDKATYKTPSELAGGVEKVFVAGKIVYADGKLTGEKPGKLLRDR